MKNYGLNWSEQNYATIVHYYATIGIIVIAHEFIDSI